MMGSLFFFAFHFFFVVFFFSFFLFSSSILSCVLYFGFCLVSFYFLRCMVEKIQTNFFQPRTTAIATIACNLDRLYLNLWMQKRQQFYQLSNSRYSDGQRKRKREGSFAISLQIVSGIIVYGFNSCALLLLPSSSPPAAVAAALLASNSCICQIAQRLHIKLTSNGAHTHTHTHSTLRENSSANLASVPFVTKTSMRVVYI